MKDLSNQFVLYGLEKCYDMINEVTRELDISNCSESYYDIKLMLIEALTNAYKHGNKSFVDKPIYLRYTLNEKKIRFEIEDCGSGLQNVAIPTKISDENMLNNNGRGLFLINSIADKVDVKSNIIIMEKNL